MLLSCVCFEGLGRLFEKKCDEFCFDMRYLEKRGFLCRQKFESLRDEKDHEIFNLREGSQKLQVQLNNGFSGFKDFKEKKAKEIQSLQAQIEDLSKVKCLS